MLQAFRRLSPDEQQAYEDYQLSKHTEEEMRALAFQAYTNLLHWMQEQQGGEAQEPRHEEPGMLEHIARRRHALEAPRLESRSMSQVFISCFSKN